MGTAKYNLQRRFLAPLTPFPPLHICLVFTFLLSNPHYILRLRLLTLPPLLLLLVVKLSGFKESKDENKVSWLKFPTRSLSRVGGGLGVSQQDLRRERVSVRP